MDHMNEEVSTVGVSTAASSGGRRGKTTRGDSNALKRVKKCIDESNFYEALQLIKMLNSRHMSQKRYDEAETTLTTGMEALLSHQQTVSASELGQQLIKLYTDTHKPPTDTTIEHIIRLFQGYGPTVDDGRVSFMKAAIKWTMTYKDPQAPSTSTPASSTNSPPAGDPRLHDALADFFTAQGHYGRAQPHFVRGTNPAKFAAMLVDFARAGESDAERQEGSGEADLFVARAVLMYLCLQKRDEASRVLRAFLDQFPALKARTTPLINYLNLLLDSLTRSNGAHLFSLLRKHYAPSLSRDPEFAQYLDQIGTVYYRLPARSGAGGLGFFNDFLKTFLSPESSDESS